MVTTVTPVVRWQHLAVFEGLPNGVELYVYCGEFQTRMITRIPWVAQGIDQLQLFQKILLILMLVIKVNVAKEVIQEFGRG